MCVHVQARSATAKADRALAELAEAAGHTLELERKLAVRQLTILILCLTMSMHAWPHNIFACMYNHTTDTNSRCYVVLQHVHHRGTCALAAQLWQAALHCAVGWCKLDQAIARLWNGGHTP